MNFRQKFFKSWNLALTATTRRTTIVITRAGISVSANNRSKDFISNFVQKIPKIFVFLLVASGEL